MKLPPIHLPRMILTAQYRKLCLLVKSKLGVVFYHFKMLRMATRAIQVPHRQICPVQILYLQFFKPRSNC